MPLVPDASIGGCGCIEPDIDAGGHHLADLHAVVLQIDDLDLVAQLDRARERSAELLLSGLSCGWALPA